MNEHGQVYNSASESIGDANEGDLFLRDDTPGRPTVENRSYGTVNYGTSGSLTGYVLQRKLDYLGDVCV